MRRATETDRKSVQAVRDLLDGQMRKPPRPDTLAHHVWRRIEFLEDLFIFAAIMVGAFVLSFAIDLGNFSTAGPLIVLLGSWCVFQAALAAFRVIHRRIIHNLKPDE